ncbi:MAG: hypothetical protein ABIP68_08345 [Ferruginibacter sp.]
MRTSYLFFSIVIFSILYSCKKEAKTINEDPQNNDSVYLSKMVIDYYGDTISYNYSYDNQKRLTKIDILENGENESDNFHYNGSDTLPYKYFLTGNQPETIYYKYANGRLIYDSTINPANVSPYIVRMFTYSNDNIIVNSHGPNNSFPSSQFFYRTVENGNTVFQTDTTDISLSVHSFTISYDNKPNPFHRMPRIYGPQIGQDEIWSVDLFEKNNATRIIENASSTTGVTESNYVYEYNSNGYPKSVVCFIDGVQFSKILFSYTSL